MASGSNNVPVISTAPGLGFSYNSDLHTFEPITNNNVGSLYLEGGKTSGKGNFSAGVNYSYTDYQTLNGQNLTGYNLSVLHQQPTASNFFNPVPPHQPLGFAEMASMNVNFNKFNLSSSTISTYFTYGLTDKWDVNVLIPVVVTDLNVQATATLKNGPVYLNGALQPDPTTYSFANGSLTNTYSNKYL